MHNISHLWSVRSLMKRSHVLTMTAALVVFGVVASVPSAFAADFSDDMEALNAEISTLESNIAAMETTENLVGALRLARLETLKITQALLKNRQLAESGAGMIEVKVPAVRPNPKRADDLLTEITRQMKVVADAEKEATTTGGLIQALAMSRVATEKLTLAQLRSAWFQAAYGIAIPTSAPPSSTVNTQSDETGTTPQSSATAEIVEWADKNFPEIDYSQHGFGQFYAEGYEISGWWAINRSKAEIDDSPQIFAINLSSFEVNAIKNPAIYVRCVEGSPSVIYYADDYLLTDYSSDSIPVAVRIDEQPVLKQAWSKLTTSKGAGLFDRRAENFIREIYDAEKVFLRLTERNGSRHDLNMKLAGGRRAYDAVAEACGFSTLTLNRDEYKAIQSMLLAAGFEIGTPDGIWGAASKRAMQQYQEKNGLPVTGVPDRASLRIMGLEF